MRCIKVQILLSACSYLDLQFCHGLHCRGNSSQNCSNNNTKHIVSSRCKLLPYCIECVNVWPVYGFHSRSNEHTPGKKHTIGISNDYTQNHGKMKLLHLSRAEINTRDNKIMCSILEKTILSSAQSYD